MGRSAGKRSTSEIGGALSIATTSLETSSSPRATPIARARTSTSSRRPLRAAGHRPERRTAAVRREAVDAKLARSGRRRPRPRPARDRLRAGPAGLGRDDVEARRELEVASVDELARMPPATDPRVRSSSVCGSFSASAAAGGMTATGSSADQGRSDGPTHDSGAHEPSARHRQTVARAPHRSPDARP